MSSYKTQKLKQLEQKMNVLKLSQVEVQGQLERINNAIKTMGILIKQEKDRTERLNLGDKRK